MLGPIQAWKQSWPEAMEPPTYLQCLLLLLLPLVRTIKVHTIHWNTSNPIFRIDNTDHIVDVNQGNLPWEYDQVNIVCPQYTRGTRPAGSERYIIYNVSKEEYESCRITHSEPRVVAVCDKPQTQLQTTITFRSFSPTPRGLEFRPGQDYYFISTSSRGDLQRRVGGSCSSHNMKVIFKVADNLNEKPPAINVPRSLPSTRRPAVRQTTVYSDGYTRRHPYRIQTYRENIRSFHSRDDEQTKNTGLENRRNSDVIKQEASTLSEHSGGSAVRGVLIVTVVFVVQLLWII